VRGCGPGTFGTGSSEHGNEPSGSIRGGEFLDQLNIYYLFKRLFSMESVMYLLYREYLSPITAFRE
jgi:hypothetical protein